MTALRVTLALLCACLSSTSAQLVWSSVTDSTSLQSGEGTFYGEGQDSQGTCSFSANFANTNDLPWSSGTDLTVALNDAQFAESSACGMCIRFRGSGAGLGTTPIPSTWTNAIVNNRCPECAKGDVDLASAGDGRWKIQWYAVPCEVGNTPLHYSIVVSSYYWFSMVVSNTRVPITGVSVNIGGTWLVLKRSVNNQWAYYNTNGPWQSSFPMGVRVTSIEGQTVEDVITSVTGNVGTKQFSADGSSSGTSAVSSTPTTGSSVPPASGTAAQPPVSAGSVPPPVPAVPVPPPVAASPPVSATPPAPSAPLTDGGFYIENYQQCGGNGGACNNKPYTAAPCGDAAWTSAVCRNQNFACVRASAELYTCVPGVRGVPPPVGSTPPPVGSTPPPVGSTPPPQPAAATPPPVQAAAQASPPVGSTPPPQQAQQYGIQLASPQSPPPTATATSTPTPTEQQYGIQPANQTPQSPPTPTPTPTSTQASGSGSPPPTPYAATSPPPTPTQQASSAASSSSLAISAGGQCGGTSQCEPAGTPTDKVTCTNGPWAGAYCPNSYECKANPGPLVWTCMPSSSATAGRRLLDGR